MGNCKKSNIQKIQPLQSKALRKIVCASHHVTNDLLHKHLNSQTIRYCDRILHKLPQYTYNMNPLAQTLASQILTSTIFGQVICYFDLPGECGHILLIVNNKFQEWKNWYVFSLYIRFIIKKSPTKFFFYTWIIPLKNINT